MKKKEVIKKAQEIVSSARKQEPVRGHLADLQSQLPDVYEHSVQVAKLAVGLGIKRGCTESQLRTLAIAGLLHDIGKLDVSEEILHKSRALTEEEKKQVDQHARLGFERLDADFFSEIRRIVVAHHEHQTDPYPRSQDRHSDCSELSEIIAAADMFVALSSSREYKESYKSSKVCEIMHKEFTGNENVIDQVLKLGNQISSYNNL
jgi:putative nucleotidyltransferase with HDIG domain